MFGFTDYAEYRRNEQEIDRRAEQTRGARELAARREDAAPRATGRRTTDAEPARPRLA